ncbi:sulfotransferase family 2 domain-containing protein [Falsiroseomonas selenitidurans]|uniref:Sulfotransferase family protein n=1 Tax=Falsiroseomonas selenitidurans TaxID=2716335 RepID=A0ABX1E3N8_9PROT|nr:sulfotransferase family 2 domain-containing protein [Falsiroseomonas selenitidurans]NKC31378.1 sulfotransferase family protein [Falsiroseomonas selenitidurans]
MPPLDLLFAGRIEAYLRAASLLPGPCIFVHVPKTAGTSLRAELAALLPPDANIYVDYTDTTRSFHARLDDAVARFLAQAAPRGIRFASGHIQGRHVAQIAQALPGARFITFLRDPVARVVSDYRHQRSPRHPGHEAFRARVPTLDAYLDQPGEREKAALHLLPWDLLREGDAAACIAHLHQHYACVGVQEMYDLSFRLVAALAGAPRAPRLRANVADDSDGGLSVTPAQAARIRALNPIDLALWQHVSDGLRGVQGRLTNALVPA